MLIIVLGYPTNAQHDSIKSEPLNNLKAILGYVNQNANFWIDNTYDTLNGGYYSYILRNGLAAINAPKTMLFQSRMAYRLSRAYMLTGNERYLEYAEKAFDFQVNHYTIYTL